MPFPVSSPQMRAMQAKDKTWFRVENAHVGDATADTTHVYIYDMIGDSWWGDSTAAQDFIKQISKIDTANIALHLNSPGGDIFDGTAIFNALKYHDAKVTVYVDGLAASAASFIAMAGDEIIMREGAMMMIHDGSAGAWGFASDLRKTADILDKLSDNIADIYAGRAGQTQRFWRDLMIEESWYTASEAVDVGLADKAEGSATEEQQAAANQWLPFFNYAGRGAAPDPLIARQRIANRLKETAVPQPTTTGPANNQADDDTSKAEPLPDAGADKVEDEEEVGTDPGTVPEPPAPPVSDAQNRAGDTAVRFSVDGQEVVMSVQAAGARLAVLEGFRNAAIKDARERFVKDLAAENKIVASQIDKLTAYAVALSDEGFDAWKATYEDAPALPITQMHGGSGTSNHNGPQSRDVEETTDQQQVHREVLAHLRKAGLDDEKLMKTPAYISLIKMDPSFKLDTL